MSACLGMRGTEVEMFAKEERVTALSAHRRCANAEPYCSLLYLEGRQRFKNTN